MTNQKIKVSLTIDTSIAERLRTLAVDDDRSLSQYINLILAVLPEKPIIDTNILKKYRNTSSGEYNIRELKIKLSLTLDPVVADKIRILADAENRSLSQYVNRLMRYHLACIDAAENNMD